MCNENCTHCDKHWRTDSGHTMSKDMIDKILSIPKEHLTISGGEPGLVPHLVRYIIENKTSSVALNTNLTLWDKEMLDFFYRNNVFLSISIVSLNKKTYEKITGKNLVHKLRQNLKLVNSHCAGITIIINKYNENEIESIVNYLAVRGFRKFTVQPSIPGLSKDFDRETYTRHISIVDKITKEHQNLDISLMSFYDTTCPKIPVNHRCEAGVDRLVILSNGNIVPCACMSPVILGNINNNIEEAIINGKRYLESFNLEDKYVCKGFLENDIANKSRNNNITPAESTLMSVKNIYASFHNVIESAKIIKSNTRSILDLGCGAGFLKDIIDESIKYIGLDIWNNSDVTCIQQADFLNSIPEEYFDCIVMNGSARFINSENELLCLFEDILKKDPEQFIFTQKKIGSKRDIAIDYSRLSFDGYETHLINIKKIDKYTNMPIRTVGFWLERKY